MASLFESIGRAYDRAVERGESAFEKYMSNVSRYSAAERSAWDKAVGDGYHKHGK